VSAAGTSIRNSTPSAPANADPCIVRSHGRLSRPVRPSPWPQRAWDCSSESAAPCDQRSASAPKSPYSDGNTGLPPSISALRSHGAAGTSAAAPKSAAWPARVPHGRRVAPSRTIRPSGRSASSAGIFTASAIPPKSPATTTGAAARSSRARSTQASDSVTKNAQARSTYAVEASQRTVGVSAAIAAATSPAREPATRVPRR
jgi:hypothetical protein